MDNGEPAGCSDAWPGCAGGGGPDPISETTDPARGCAGRSGFASDEEWCLALSPSVSGGGPDRRSEGGTLSPDKNTIVRPSIT